MRTYLGGTARQVRVDLGDQVQNIEVADIARIEFSSPPPPPPPPPQEAPPPPPQQLGITLPAGTNFTIRMIDSVDSQKAKTGDTFAASLDSPVTDPANGNIAIPRGADVVVKLVDSKQSGKIAGRAELALALMSVRINGQLVEINTQTVSEKSSDRAGRSAREPLAAVRSVGLCWVGFSVAGRARPSAWAPEPPEELLSSLQPRASG